ncbi:MAG: DUF502 domain-containing protein [Candidatus Nanohalobium sp.]
MGVYRLVKDSFKSGMVMLLPLLVTVLIIKFLADYVFLFINPIVKSTNLAQYTANIEIVAQGLATFTVVGVITLMGYISSYRASERLSMKTEAVIKEIPVFGTVYSTIDQISRSFRGESRFKDVILVEFPEKNFYSLGLITSEAPETVEEKTGEEMKTVYIPFSPNPTMGNLVMIPEEQYTEIDMKIQKAMKLLLTSGIAYEEKEIPEKIKKEL